MGVKIITGDCREVLLQLEPRSFDCILTDPPYGETSLEWDKWVANWPSLAFNLLKPTGSMWVFGSQRMFWDHRDEFLNWNLAQDVIWEKHNGSGFHADRFKRVHEIALQFYRKGAPWGSVFKSPQYTLDATARAVRRKKRPAHMGHIEASAYVSEDGGPRLQRSVIYCRSEHGRAEHRTQKPLGIVEPLLRYSCPPGGLVLDMFAGSGTTGIAAARNGANAVLIEAKPEFVEIAMRRCSVPDLLQGEAA